jgi:uncharacterized protein YhfF
MFLETRKSMINGSVEKMWTNYLESLGESHNNTDKTYTAWYFCDNKQDADELAELVLEGTKKATASLYLYYSSENEGLPKEGELSIIIVPFKDVTEEFAQTEGEGDKSLKYWKRAHKNYFSRELIGLGREFNEDILVVCEKFEVVYK